MKLTAKNIPDSVHQRLLNKARESSRPFNELLQHYAIERFIYRISKSAFRERFILKGALMFAAWNMQMSRPTKDIDLLGIIDNSPEVIVAAIKKACELNVEPDGMSFDARTVSAEKITEDANYEGVRVRLQGNLGNARISLQVDIGFGDIIFPGAVEITYPTILDFPPAKLKGYSKESTIAEKFQAMVKLGVLTGRMRDFFDVWMFSQAFDFKGQTLGTAIRKTFENRKTEIPAEPLIFQDSFAKDKEKEIQWQAFLKRGNIGKAPKTFADAIRAIKEFLGPITAALTYEKSFEKKWFAPGPWR